MQYPARTQGTGPKGNRSLSDDARQQPRQETLKGAIIIAADKPRWNCLISNISDEGAELKLEGDERLPQHFTLDLPGEGVTYRAAVRWREEGRIGVEFLAKEIRKAPRLKLAS